MTTLTFTLLADGYTVQPDYRPKRKRGLEVVTGGTKLTGTLSIVMHCNRQPSESKPDAPAEITYLVPACKKCGEPEEACLLIYTGEPFMDSDVDGLTLSCKNRCFVDMTCHREPSEDELRRWKRRWKQ
jgi:hypothetical protein